MKAYVQHTLGMLTIMLIMFTTVDVFAQGRGRGKGKDKDHFHQKGKYHADKSEWNHGKHHKGGPPSWAPAHGYRAKNNHRHADRHIVRYVYNPDYNIYFDRQREVYIYVSHGRWVVNARLPMSLNNRSVRNGFLVELSLHGATPYTNNHRHLRQYRKYAKRRYYAYCDH